MSSVLSTIRSYIPHSLLELLLRQETLLNEPIQHSFEGAILFADISGFTPLTEALSKKGDEGPEEITQLLNRYFMRMIKLLESEGGDVVKFSGDALTVLFPITDEPLGYVLRRAKQAADAMQEMMRELAPVQTSVGPVDLGLKVGIGGGRVMTLLVGGVFRRWEYVLTGEALLQAATAEGTIQRGQVCLSPEALAVLHPESLLPRAAQAVSLEEREDLPEVILRLKRFLPGAVRSWMVHEEFHDWLGVLRTMSVLFIGLSGIDYEDSDVCERLHSFLREAQATVYRYQGSINKLAVDDKGTIFLVLFGAPPFAHSDDPLRAVRCALDLRNVASSQGLSLRIGVTTGRVFAGPVGSDLRREYTAMGDGVNLAARLMGQSDADGILCDVHTHKQTEHHVAFEILPPAKLKGKAQLIPIFRPLHLLKNTGSSAEGETMIGRLDELAQLVEFTKKIASEQNQVILLEGEAGIGKTILLRALGEQVLSQSSKWLYGAGQSLEQLSGYWAWRDIFSQLFVLDEAETTEKKEELVRNVFKQYPSEYQERISLLNDMLGLHFEDSELTASLDASTRQQSLSELLLFLLTHREDSSPLCLVMENLQWLDSLSWELVIQLVRSLEATPSGIMFLLSSRPLGVQALVANQMKVLKSFEQTESLLLGPLSDEETLALVATKLELSPLHVPKELELLIHRRSGGNPLFVREIIGLLTQKNILEFSGKKGFRTCQLKGKIDETDALLPDSLEGLLLARMDELSPTHQMILKVASVLGQTFAYPPLHHTLGEYSQSIEQSLREQLETLSKQGFTHLEKGVDSSSYVFTHLAAQEVAYRTLLYQQRRQLHRSLAKWYEDTQEIEEPVHSERDNVSFSSLPGLILSTVAHHWRHAGEDIRERHYTRLAGEHAARLFANQEAIQHFTRVIELIPRNETQALYSSLRERESLFDIVGERQKQLEDLEALEVLAESLTDGERVEVALAKGQYALAIADFDQALEIAQGVLEGPWKIENPKFEALLFQLWGRALVSVGRLDEAREKLEKALSLAREHQEFGIEAATLRVIGNTYAMRSAFDQALSLFQKAFDVHVRLNEHTDAIKALNNIGLIYRLVHRSGDQLDQAIKVFSDALQRARQIGSKTLESLVIGNLASAYIELERFGEAQLMLERGLRLSREVGSPNDECTTFVFLGEVSLRVGAYKEAEDFFRRAIAQSQDIGHQYMETYGQMYLAETLTLSGDTQRAEPAIEEAAKAAKELGDPTVVTEGELLLGHLHFAKKEYELAQSHYQHAREGYEKLSSVSEAMEALSGLARVALSFGKEEDALAFVDQILGHIEEQGTQGMHEPFWVIQTCVEVLRIHDKKRANLLLQSFLEKMQAQVDLLPSSFQESFVRKIGVAGLKRL